MLFTHMVLNGGTHREEWIDSTDEHENCTKLVVEISEIHEK